MILRAILKKLHHENVVLCISFYARILGATLRS